MQLLTSTQPVCRKQTPFGPIDLLLGRAVLLPEHQALLVADVHLGKAATFRQLGVPVPAGTTQDNLNRLTALMLAHQPAHLVFLGDLLHARAAHNPDLLQALAAWRSQHAAVGMTLVRGNHDDRAGDPPASLNIAVVDEPWAMGRFSLCHHPQTVAGQLVIAGHVHPVVHLQGKGRDRARLPCFHCEGGVLTLPAFGTFTGGHPVKPDAADWCVPVVG